MKRKQKVAKSNIDWYLSKNFQLVRQDDKVPTDPWKDGQGANKLDLLCHEGCIGAILTSEHVVIDVDDELGHDSFNRLMDDYGFFIDTFTVKSPSGYHIYMKNPNPFPVRTTIPKYPNVEFKSYGHLITISGSTLSTGEKYTFQDRKIHTVPDSLCNLIRKPSEIVRSLSNRVPQLYSEPSDVEEMLTELDPSMSYPYWVKIGMALHSWDNTKGLELWEGWSRKSNKYQDGECHKKWSTFSDKGTVSVGTIKHLSSEQRLHREEFLLVDFNVQLEESTPTEMISKVAPDIKSANLTKSSQNIIEKTFKDIYYKKTAIRLSSNELIKYLRTYENIPINWIDDYVYVGDVGGYFNLRNRKLITTKTFDEWNTKHVPFGKGATKPNASKYIRDRGLIKIVDNIIYYPTCPDVLITHNGVNYVNSYQKKHFDVPDSLTEEEKVYGERIVKHFETILPDKDAEVVKYWMAHQVQNEGHLLLWAMLIEGVDGLGKTIIYDVMSVLLGRVKTITSTEIRSAYNDWAYGSSLITIEELKVSGQNRYQILDIIKPLITNKEIAINQKYMDSYSVLNTCNYLALTNHKDAIPITDSDRRWFVTFARFQSKQELQEHLKQPLHEYFKQLMEGLEHPRFLKKYFLDIEIPDWFKNLIAAPQSDSRRLLIDKHQFERSYIRDYIPGMQEAKESIEEIIEMKWYAHDEILVSTLFFEDVYDVMEPTETRPCSKDRKRILMELGYIHNHGQVRINKNKYRVYTKTKMTTEKIKEMLG